jgi:phosphatidylethanolamine/phosphatidyl-N-methylethanolamine N-methyltransferase
LAEPEADRPLPAQDGFAHTTRTARVTQRRYDRIAPVYDLFESAMERARYRLWRERLWRGVSGPKVLEVGVGTGRNLPYHPVGADVIGVDLSPRMLARARGRTALSAAASLNLGLMDAQALAFGSAVFDAAVATFVFCSVPDPVRGLREVRRALKPGGHLWLLEHVRSSRPLLGRVMDLLNPIMVRLTGANINRDTVANVAGAGFEVDRVTELDTVGIYRLIEATAPGGPPEAEVLRQS